MTDTRDELALADELARVLCAAAGKVSWTEVIPAVYRDQAEAILASGVLANLRAEAKREGAIEALEEAADERGELWMLGTNSVHYDCAETVATWLHGRAADFYAQKSATS